MSVGFLRTFPGRVFVATALMAIYLGVVLATVSGLAVALLAFPIWGAVLAVRYLTGRHSAPVVGDHRI